MVPIPNAKKKLNLLFIPAALTYLAVFLDALFQNGAFRVQPISLGLLIAFALVFFIPGKYHANLWISSSQIVVETILISALLVLHPGWGVYPILFFLVATEVALIFSQRTAFLWYSIFTAITAAIFINSQGMTGLVTLLPFAAGYWFFGIFGWTSSLAEKERQRSDRLLAELQASHAQLQEYATRVEELATVQERNRIAREVHDSLGHRLTVAAVQLEGAQRLVTSNPPRAEAIIGTVREQVREGLAELRRTVAMLRSQAEEDMTLCTAIAALSKQFEEATGIVTHLDLEECPADLLPAGKHSFYRAAQEGLTNVQRHARASEVWIDFIRRDGRITLLIGDNGAGLSTTEGSQTDHFGLRGLAEQAEILGGDFRLDPRPGGGVQLTFCLPEAMEASHE